MESFDFNSAYAHSREQDTAYADCWLEETALWKKMGVYEFLAKKLDLLEPGAIHVDFGTGLGIFALRLKELNPQAHVIGIEKNLTMVRDLLAATQAISNIAMPRVYHREILTYRNGKLESLYLTADELEQTIVSPPPFETIQVQTAVIQPHNEKTDEDFMELDRAIRIVVDDMRSLNLLKSLLGDRQIDSASLLFPGGSGRLAIEAPFCASAMMPIKKTGEDRIKQEVLASLKAAFDFAAQALKPGGTLLTADRMADILGREESAGMVIANTKNRMTREAQDVFDWPAATVYMPDFHVERPQSGVDWVRLDPRISQNAPTKISMVKLRKKGN